jgi:Mrp family chromosome partitioning ATPase/capsular polysaccharide biosynthesis protein
VSSRNDTGEQPIEVRRYLDALRRSLPLIVAITLALALTAFVVSSLLSKRYDARASLVRQQLSVLDQGQSADDATRELNTIAILLTTKPVLRAAAVQVPGETADSLQGKVSARVDPAADVVYVTGSASSATRAAAIANAVSRTYVAQRAALERRQAQSELADLQHELGRLRRNGASATQLEAIQQRISDLGVSVASAGTDLSLADPATPPTHQSAPHPLRDAGLGVVLGLFIGVLVAVGREQLVPRVGSARELARLLDLPVLVSVPAPGWRGSSSRPGLEHEAYQGLATAVRLALPPGGAPQSVLVTSAVRAEGKTTVVAQLGDALARAGHRTLLVSADLRHPTLHEGVGVPQEPGLAELLVGLPRRSAPQAQRLVTRAVRHLGDRRRVLDVLPSGRPTGRGDALDGPALDVLFDVIGELDYAYVLVDSPSVLGVADAQALAHRCSSSIVVARLDRLSVENVDDLREAIDRFERRSLGLVVIGGRAEALSSYVGERAPAYEDV